jgi:hypothetical protein
MGNLILSNSYASGPILSDDYVAAAASSMKDKKDLTECYIKTLLFTAAIIIYME